MRKCAVLVFSPLALLSLALPSPASAQALALGAGPTFPTGDYKDFGDNDGARTGWMAGARVIFPIGPNGLAGFVSGLYGSNNHEYGGDKTDLLGGFGGVEYVFAEEGEAGPFVFAQAGVLRPSYKSDDFPQYEASRSGFAFGGGAGYIIPLRRLYGWVRGQYIQGQLSDDETGEGNITFFGVMAGVSVPVGG